MEKIEKSMREMIEDYVMCENHNQQKVLGSIIDDNYDMHTDKLTLVIDPKRSPKFDAIYCNGKKYSCH